MHDPFTLALLALVLALQIGFKALDMLSHKKNNNASGQKPSSYWELTITRIIDKALEPLAKNQEEMLKNQTKMMEEMLRGKGGQ